MGSSLIRGALDECEELRARRAVAISILRTFSSLHNKGRFQRAVTRKVGEGFGGYLRNSKDIAPPYTVCD